MPGHGRATLGSPGSSIPLFTYLHTSLQTHHAAASHLLWTYCAPREPTPQTRQTEGGHKWFLLPPPPSVKSSGLGKSRQMPGRDGDLRTLHCWLQCLPSYSTSLHSCPTYASSPHLLSQLGQVLARCCSPGQPEAHGGCSLLRTSSTVPPGIQQGWGLGGTIQWHGGGWVRA